MQVRLQVAVVSAFSFLCVGAAYGGTEDAFFRLNGLKSDIVLLNILNGLELTPEQAKAVHRAVSDFVRGRRELAAELEKARVAGVLDLYKKLLCAGNTWRSMSRADRKRISDAVRKYNAVIEKERQLRVEAAERIADVLQDFQKQMLVDFKPCMIPPPSGLSIGQVGSNYKRFEKQLEKLRGLPEEAYRKRRGEIARRMAERLKKKRPLVDVESVVKRIEEEMDRVRSMSDTDFMVNKRESARRMHAALHPSPRKVELTGRIAHLLVREEILPLLERIAAGKKVK